MAFLLVVIVDFTGSILRTSYIRSKIFLDYKVQVLYFMGTRYQYEVVLKYWYYWYE